MQSLKWYCRRLRSMSLPEVLWRLRASVREPLDRCLYAARRRPVDLQRVANVNGEVLTLRPEVVGSHLPDFEGMARWAPQAGQWAAALMDRARRICKNRLSIFDLEDHDLGPAVDWNYEYKAKKESPIRFAPAIDYRDYRVTGDCKFVWELNRHQHLVVLGRAYRLSGDRGCAEAVVAHLKSWLRQCPYGTGMNWRSPLELAIRLINWVWAIELISPSGAVTAEFSRQLLPAVYRHLWEISRNYSRFSSANNHLIGEAAGVFVGSSYFRCFKNARKWQKQSRDILVRAIVDQTYRDGGSREQAMGYHLFVLEFFLLAGLVAKNINEDFPREYWNRLERMFEFVGGLARGGDRLPMFGDADDGYVLNLGGRNDRARGLLAVGAAVFHRADCKGWSDGFSQPAFWLLGSRGYDRFERLQVPAECGVLRSQAFPHSGYYLLQHGHGGADDAMSVCFDCGDLGLGPIAAHGHADALSFTLRAFGVDVFIDPGTYDYFTYGRWRDYFRSTAGHNTISIDGRNQSEMLGPFLWGRRATARCIRWEPSDDGGTVAGEHDGYAASPGRVRHRRTITLNGRDQEVLIHDELVGKGRHVAASHFHLSEQCSTRQVDRDRFHVACGSGSLIVDLDPCLSVSQVRGSEEPILGWISRGYHRKEPTTTLVGLGEWENSLRLTTRIAVK